MKRKSQSLTEYAVLMLIVAAALISMRSYMQRGIQAVVKGPADQLADRVPVAGLGHQQYVKDSIQEGGSNLTSHTTVPGSTRRTITTTGGTQTNILNSASTTTGESHSWTAQDL